MVKPKDVKQMREDFPPGTKICLDNMCGEPQMPKGLAGTVRYVDDAGQIHVQWENGSSLALCEKDLFHRVPSLQEG